jgi:predicted aconitase with swiveling domain
MKILAISHDVPGAEWSGRESLLREEAKKIWELHTSDIIREIFFTAPDRKAVIMMEHDSVVAAARILSELPLVRAKLIEFTIVQLTAYDGYERLFDRS